MVLPTKVKPVDPPLREPENTKLLPPLDNVAPDRTESDVVPVVNAHR